MNRIDKELQELRDSLVGAALFEQEQMRRLLTEYLNGKLNIKCIANYAKNLKLRGSGDFGVSEIMDRHGFKAEACPPLMSNYFRNIVGIYNVIDGLGRTSPQPVAIAYGEIINDNFVWRLYIKKQTVGVFKRHQDCLAAVMDYIQKAKGRHVK